MTELQLDGLHCANCAVKIEQVLKDNTRFSQVNLSFATKKLHIESSMDSQTLENLIQTEIDKIEQGITVKSEDEKESLSLKDLSFKHIKTILGSLILSAAVFMNMPQNIQLTLYVTAYLFIGGGIAFRAVKNLFRGRLFDEYFLMTLATLGAFALGEYTEAVAVMLFYRIGEAFQEYAVDYSRRSIQSLLNIKAEFANLLEGESSRKVEPEILRPGDLILVRAGEKIPVDGRIVQGETSLNQAALTGESFPREVNNSDDVLSGCINISSPITIEVTKSFENSAVSRILNMVENASGKKAPTEQFITKFARIYTPVIVIGALLLAFLPPLLFQADLREWISRSLIFLVISCPCALVLSVPLGFFGGLGSASRRGILIKGGNYLEALNNIDVVIFDKTGTLTEGNFIIEKVTDRETHMLAALLEQQSTHPIAQSISKAYDFDIDYSELREISEIPGMGMTGVFRQKKLFVGNGRLMRNFKIDFPEEEYAGTIVHVAYDHAYRGSIHITDEIKTSCLGLSERLKSDGIEQIIMLTGDQSNIAQNVAGKLKIDDVYSELLPEDKMDHLERVIESGKKVIFVGDGINDAPVLMRANIGIAMGGLGSDAAIEASDIVLMTDDPSKLLDARQIARKTKRIVLQNIFFALIIKGFFLTLGALGYANMYEAIFADVGVALLAVLNSMRILKN